MPAEAEVEVLRGRLAEAEETLRAIRGGAVDALVVGDVGNDEVLPLGRADDACHALLEAMDIGAAAFDERNCLFYVNKRLASMLGREPEELHARSLDELFGQRAAEVLNSLIQKAAGGKDAVQLTLDRDGSASYILATASPLPLAFGTGWAVTFTDITNRVQKQAAEETERVGRSVLTSAFDPVLVCNSDGRVTQANPAMVDLLGFNPVDGNAAEVLPLQFEASSGLINADDVVNMTLAGNAISSVDATIDLRDGRRDLIASTTPLRQASGIIVGCILALQDITERKALEKRQLLLMHELDHRMKNMLTMVASIGMRTIATSDSLEDFKGRFGSRLSALATTQSLLSSSAWAKLSLRALIRAKFEPFISAADERLALVGLDRQVSRDAAVALGLVFHELVTNAVKYGALSNEGGVVTVTGTQLCSGALELEWRECGGPTVLPPKRQGFGQTLIARGLGAIAAEPTQVEFAPQGMVCRLTISPTYLSED